MIIMSKDKEITKTNAARLLDSVGIAYELIPYSYSEDDLSAQSVAAELGEDIDMVFKTLVLRGDKNGLFVCVTTVLLHQTTTITKTRYIDPVGQTFVVPNKSLLSGVVHCRVRLE